MRIGFIDYKLGNFHSNTFLKNFRGPLASRGYEVSGAYCIDSALGKEWCEKNGVKWFDSVEAMNPHVDYYIILAPGNPETHLDLARRTFPFSKPTYVDKTFAPNLDVAKEIFTLADRHRVKVQTTSALRYTEVQKKLGEIGRESLKHMIAWGSGSSFSEYAIHAVELIISCMGPGATSLMRRGSGDYSQLLINFTNDRTAVANLYVPGDTPYAATLTNAKTTAYVPVDLGTLFLTMSAEILNFFEAPKALIDRGETLTVLKILDAATDPRALREFISIA